MKKILVPVIILVLVTLVLGCSSSATTTSIAPTTTAPTTTSGPIVTSTTAAPSSTTIKPTSTTSAQPTTTATTAPVRGGTLRIGSMFEANNIGWGPLITSGIEWFKTSPCVEHLFRLDASGQNIPFLAESYKEDPANLTIIVYLRKGVKFHDGTPFNATACKWNLDQYKASAAGGRNFQDVKSIDILDDYTVRLTLSKWNNLISGYLSGDPGQMLSPLAFQEHGMDWMRLNPVGTGPFKFVSWTRDVSLIYERFPDYWQPGKPYLDRIEIYRIADATVQMMSFLNGDLDVVQDVTPKVASDLEAKGYKASMGTVRALMYGLVPNSVIASSPFTKLEVRQAMCYAVDLKTIAATVLKGKAIYSNQLAMPGAVFYNPNVKGYPYNPEKAKQLLAQAGYPNGFDTKLSIRSDQNSIDTFTAVQDYLNKAGIRATMDIQETSRYANTFLRTGWDALCATIYSGVPDPLTALVLYFYKSDSPDGSGKSVAHFSELDTLMEKAGAATSFEEKQKYEWEIQSFIIDQKCTFLPALALPTISVKTSKVHNDGIQVPHPYYWEPENAWMDKK